ncbi:hypothetical protein FE391_40065 [Nonomuraea sp. KC401]|nr:hypothetical protein FE391_40065 [Nonomuraea sp. KC401]
MFGAGGQAERAGGAAEQEVRPQRDVHPEQGVRPEQGAQGRRAARGTRGQAPRHGMAGAPAMPQSRGARHRHPDQQVWPPAPAPREPLEGLTQPLPAVQPSADQPPHDQSPAYDQAPPYGGPAGSPSQGAAAAATAGVGAAAAIAASHDGAPSHDGVRPEGARDGVRGRARAGGGRRSAKGSRNRKILIAAGAVVVSLLAMGAQTVDGYLFYEKVSAEQTKEVVVAAGQAGNVHNIEWTAAVAPVKAPAGSKHGPEVTWLQVNITKKVVDEASATMTAMPYDIRLSDRGDRTWTVELKDGERPTDRLVVGKTYKIEGLAIVPTPVANEVEISFRPSAYRSDTPVDDLFDREAMEKAEKDDTVLRFRRR